MPFRVICDMCGAPYTMVEWQDSDQLLLTTPEEEEMVFCTWACLGEFTLNTLREFEKEDDRDRQEETARMAPPPSRPRQLKPVQKRVGDVVQEDERDYREEDAAVLPPPQGIKIDNIRIKK
jgi:hypothetical protein